MPLCEYVTSLMVAVSYWNTMFGMPSSKHSLGSVPRGIQNSLLVGGGGSPGKTDLFVGGGGGGGGFSKPIDKHPV